MSCLVVFERSTTQQRTCYARGTEDRDQGTDYPWIGDLPGRGMKNKLSLAFAILVPSLNTLFAILQIATLLGSSTTPFGAFMASVYCFAALIGWVYLAAHLAVRRTK